MYIRLTGTHKEKPRMIIEFYGKEQEEQLLYLEGTKPFLRRGLTLEEAEKIVRNAGYEVIVEEVDECS